ncbi:MAG: galactose oxidase-like domain-containing protein, partial [Acidimicrobiia bacterium]
ADVGVAELEGIRAARLFDPETSTFSPAADMHYGRWYPTLVTLADGRVLAASGMTRMVKDTQLSQVRRSELYDPALDRWTATTGPGSETSLPLYPRLHVMPDGRVLYNGVGETWGPFGYAVDESEWAFQKLFDPGTGQWETVGPALGGARGGAFEVMLPLRPPYSEATMLTFGGTLGPSPGTGLATNLSTLTTVTRDGRVTARTTGPLHNRRWSSDGVLLPDGNVLATNGGDKDSPLLPGFEMPVHQAELFDPRTGTWTPMASSSRDRVYHITAALLPDGRVMVGGNAPAGAGYGGRRSSEGPFANNEKDPSFEIFSPPYLFRGERPSITYAPADVAWNSSFPIRTTRADEIVSVVLIRTPSPQHNLDSDQRAVELAFTSGPGSGVSPDSPGSGVSPESPGSGVSPGSDTLTAVAPPNGAIAPPGFYYLFVNRRSPLGPVPSVARIVKVGAASDAQPAFQPMMDSTVPAGRMSATPAPGGGSLGWSTS